MSVSHSEIKHIQDDTNVSFKVTYFDRKIRVNILYRGKINILGAIDFHAQQVIYDFLNSIIKQFIVEQPKPNE